jgi:hypothetical protein
VVLPQGWNVGVTEPRGHQYPSAQLPEQLLLIRPDVAAQRPAAHAWGDDDPSTQYMVQGHTSVHRGLLVAGNRPNRPAAHGLHNDAPSTLYVPAGQATAVALVDPGGHAYPAVQGPEHELLVSALALPNTPPGHGVHNDAPPRLYVPTGQATAEALVDPGGHAYPAVQGPRQDASARPGTPYLPPRHRPLQEGVCREALLPYTPAGHWAQVPAPARLYDPEPHWTAVGDVDPGGHA